MVRQKKQGRWKRPLVTSKRDPKPKGNWGCPQHGREFQVRTYKHSRHCGYNAGGVSCGWKSGVGN